MNNSDKTKWSIPPGVEALKKIGIITICDYQNYGNRLQNYAVQEILVSLGFHVETIVNKQVDFNNSSNMFSYEKLKRIFSLPKKEILAFILKKAEYKLTKSKRAALSIEKKKAFKEFTKKYICETDYSISVENIPEGFSEKFDLFVAGSDQIWNPIFRKGSPIDFLAFAPEAKRIAYAPSFGLSHIPDDYVENYRNWLNGFSYLSVREERGAEIIKELTGRDAPVLIDPTMMLSKNKWLTISKPIMVNSCGNFLLTYFLSQKSNKLEKEIKSIAKKNNLVIINLNNVKEKIFYKIDPSEFLFLINSAAIVLTDSFHGTIFSILFEKPFVTFERIENRPSMNSRIDTLLNKLNLEARRWENIKGNENLFDIDYSGISDILDRERKKAISYLRKALARELNNKNSN